MEDDLREMSTHVLELQRLVWASSVTMKALEEQIKDLQTILHRSQNGQPGVREQVWALQREVAALREWRQELGDTRRESTKGWWVFITALITSLVAAITALISGWLSYGGGPIPPE